MMSQEPEMKQDVEKKPQEKLTVKNRLRSVAKFFLIIFIFGCAHTCAKNIVKSGTSALRDSAKASDASRQLKQAEKETGKLVDDIIAASSSPDKAVTDDIKKTFEDSQKESDAQEKAAYERRASLSGRDVFRRVKWWMSPEDVLKSEESRSDVQLLDKNYQPIPDLKGPDNILYRLDPDETNGLLKYSFGRVTNGLNAISILYIGKTDEGAKDIWSEFTQMFKDPSFTLAKRQGPENYGFWYNEWLSSDTRVSLSRKDFKNGKSNLTMIFFLYTPPGYGGEMHPIGHTLGTFITLEKGAPPGAFDD